MTPTHMVACLQRTWIEARHVEVPLVGGHLDTFSRWAWQASATSSDRLRAPVMTSSSLTIREAVFSLMCIRVAI